MRHSPALAFAPLLLPLLAFVPAAAAAVPTVTYHRLDTVYTTGVAIRPDTPNVVGTVVVFQADSALPAGLLLGAATGILSGTPTTATAAADYHIKAANFTDSVIVTLRIGVVTLALPSNFQYPLDSVQYVNVPLKLTPSVTGVVTKYSVLPALPAGLVLDSKTGIITGAPEAAEKKTCVVTAQNASGTALDTLVFNLRSADWVRIVSTVDDDIAPVAPIWDVCDYAPDGSVGFAVGVTGFNLDGVHTPVVQKIVPGSSVWTQTYLDAAKGSLVKVQIPNATTGYVLASNGVLFKTLSGGGRWDSISAGVPTRGLSFPSTTVGYAVGLTGRVDKTVNGGLTWTSLTAPSTEDLNDVEFSSVDTGYVVGNMGVVAKTLDGGATWQTLGIGTDAALSAVAFENGRTGYVAGNSTLLRTTDGGATWKPQNTGELTIGLTGLSAPTPGVAFVSSSAGFVLKYTATAQPQPAPPASPTLASPAQNYAGAPVSTQLMWNTSSGAGTYRVQLSKDSTFATMMLNDSTVTSTSRTTGTLENATRYHWRVNARNADGISAYSEIRHFTTATVSGTLPALVGENFSLRQGALFYTLPLPVLVQIRLLDLNGALIWVYEGRQEAGPQTAALPRSPGQRSLYLLEFRAGTERKTLKILLD